MKKHLCLTLLLIALSSIAFAQIKEPDWVTQNPKPKNTSYLYSKQKSVLAIDSISALRETVESIITKTGLRIDKSFNTEGMDEALKGCRSLEDINKSVMSLSDNLIYVESFYWDREKGIGYLLCQVAKNTTMIPKFVPMVKLPLVITNLATNITQYSANAVGEVTDDGGAPIEQRGICWNDKQNPTTSDRHVLCGSGTGSFTGHMNALVPNTTYYVKAFAKNSEGISYGDEVSFTTLEIIKNKPVYWHSFLLPGLAQMEKGYKAEGVCTLAAEVILIGGGVASYFGAQNQLEIMKDPNVTIDAFNAAQSKYNTLRATNIGTYCVAGALYAFNIYRAVTLKDKSGKHLVYYPTAIISDNEMAWGIGFTYNF